MNFREAEKATAYAKVAESEGVQQKDICILAPFSGQISLLKEMCRADNLGKVRVEPIDALQVIESRLVIICTTRASTEFLQEDVYKGKGVIGESRKFNVAVTRAREGLIVVGNPWLLDMSGIWAVFLDFCYRNKLWKEDVDETFAIHGEERSSRHWKPEKGVVPAKLELEVMMNSKKSQGQHDEM